MKAANDNFTEKYDEMLEQVRIAMATDQGTQRMVEAYKEVTQSYAMRRARE